MTIHDEHPFAPAESGRSPARRFRSRLTSPVTLWTASHQGERAGLTVSSLLVADGEPGIIVGILDPLSDLWDALRASGRAVVTILEWPDRNLAEAFGYVAPAPGGPFTLAQWTESEWGPRLATDRSERAWAGCLLADVEHPTAGWGILVRLEIVQVELGPSSPQENAPLAHLRGRYSAAS